MCRRIFYGFNGFIEEYSTLKKNMHAKIFKPFYKNSINVEEYSFFDRNKVCGIRLVCGDYYSRILTMPGKTILLIL